MLRFRNILVGVDLSGADRFVVDALLDNAPAVREAMWLADRHGAKVTFVYAIEVAEHTREAIRQAEERTVLDDARDVLQAMVRHAGDRGVTASFKVVFGRAWMELVRRVLEGGHDLVLVGAGRRGGPFQSLFGGTAMKLLRKCPCPVWVTKPSETEFVGAVLAAHDLTPVGTAALQIAASLAELQNSPLHVLHVVEGSDPATARTQIEAELAEFRGAVAPRVAIADGRPADAILEYVDKHGIELVVMGTIARSGVAGLITGNTAERLLPRLPCSVLAIKPEGFVSPVALD